MRRLANLDVGELGFLEIRIDIKLVDRHERRDLLAGGNEVALLAGKIADHTVERRAQARKRKIACSLIAGKFQRFSRACRFIILRFENGNIGLGGCNLRIYPGQPGAGLDLLVCGYGDVFNIAGDLGCDGGNVALNIGIVCRNHEAPDGPPVIAIPERAYGSDGYKAGQDDALAEAFAPPLADTALSGTAWGCVLSLAGASFVAG